MGAREQLLEIAKVKANQSTTEKKLALGVQMYTKIKTYRIFKIDDKLMRKLFEFKASNQDKLHPTMK